MKLRYDEIITILGKRGSGKSYLVTYLFTEAGLDRYIIFDIEGEYIGCVEGKVVRDTQQLCNAIKQGETKFVFNPVGMTQKELQDEYDLMCRFFWENRIGNFFVVVDEAWMIYPEADKWRIGTFAQGIAFRGRKRGLALLVMGQRLQAIAKNVITQSGKIILMQGVSEYDLAYIKTCGYAGLKPLMDSLQKFEFLEVLTRTKYKKVTLREHIHKKVTGNGRHIGNRESEGGT